MLGFWAPRVSGDNGHTGHGEAFEDQNFREKSQFCCGNWYFDLLRVPVGWCLIWKIISLGICPEHRSFDRVLDCGSSEPIPGLQPFAIELLRDFCVFQAYVHFGRKFSPKTWNSSKFLIFHVGFAHPGVSWGADMLCRGAKTIKKHF